MPTHSPTKRSGILQSPEGKLSVVIAIAALLPLPVFATGPASRPHTPTSSTTSTPSAPTPTQAEITRGSGWYIMWSYMQSIERTLNDPDYAAPPDADSEEANTKKAIAQMDRYLAHGPARPISAEQAAAWRQDIQLTRQNILANPDQFTDPVWSEFSTYLDLLEAGIQ